MKNLVVIVVLYLGLSGSFFAQGQEIESIRENYSKIEFRYDKLPGIGYEKGCTRRDPSDVIKAGDTYYVYYTKIYGRAPGYWGTVWYATSKDEGYTWKEQGEILGLGKKDMFDSQATFTPNILFANGKYYLYYTGVKPTPGNEKGEFENNSTTDITAIGVAVSDSPDGPFVRACDEPILKVSAEPEKFDSYRVDDAALLYRNGLYWLYYKGRSRVNGVGGPALTKMGVAFSKNPEGPFTKYGKPILPQSHEVIIWQEGTGIAALASLSSTFEYAPDGIDFLSNKLGVNVKNLPMAPGVFRQDLTDLTVRGEGLKWGISMVHNGDECYLIRYCQNSNTSSTNKISEKLENLFPNMKGFELIEISGIGYDSTCYRRDNSNVIEINGYYYVYYNKGQVWKNFRTGWKGSVWCARSRDGKHWEEIGEMVPEGSEGEWDHWATYCPNILVGRDGKYYLYFTGQKENQAADRPIYIGVAIGDSPEGPFIKYSGNPVFSPTNQPDDFDGHRVDDASVIVRNDGYWMYYKGRAFKNGKPDGKTVALTKIGLAFSNSPIGPWRRFEDNPVINEGHEIMVWPQKEGVGVLARFAVIDEKGIGKNVQGLYWAPDGKNFKKYSHPEGMMLANPGGFIPDCYIDDGFGNGATWGISFTNGKKGGADCYLLRWELNLTVSKLTK